MVVSIKSKIIQSIKEIEQHYSKGLKDENRLVDLIETFQRQKKHFTDSEQTDYSERLKNLKQKKIQVVVPKDKDMELYDPSPSSSPKSSPTNSKPEPFEVTTQSPSEDSVTRIENESKEDETWV